MAAGNSSSEGLGDDFIEQMLVVPSASEYGWAASEVGFMPVLLQLGSSRGDDGSIGGFRGSLGIGTGMGMGIPSGLKGGRRRFTDDGNHLHPNNVNNSTSSSSSSTSGITRERNSVHMTGMFSTFGQLHGQSLRPAVPSPSPPAHPQLGQSEAAIAGCVVAAPQPPGIRPRVRARRGQVTDPHSIAERLRCERIAQRKKALQELVPSANKTYKAAMLDEIVDYVKFLRLQVQVPSMSRVGGDAQLVADVPSLYSMEGEGIEQAWMKWSYDGTEQEVAKLMDEDVGAAMQFLQSKALCIMPISLASAIFCAPHH